MERTKISSNAEMLREAVNNIAVVDAHAHNLVPLHSKFPFIQCFTEARGEATKDVPHTLSFKRSIRDIAKLYNCATTLEAVEKCRSFLGLETMCSKCFSATNISAVLLDDGIQIDKMYNMHWHKNHVSVVGRILRIETLAEEILSGDPPDGMTWTLGGFTNLFLSTLKSLSKDVVGFKSIAAYRSGLNINSLVTSEDADDGLHKDLHASMPIRISSKSFVDYIFTHSLEVAASFDLPMQIHTGFGDTDLDLRLANPLHLRPILEDDRFKKCRIVLLHASYPYSKEASYLASVYPQVYLDFGLAVPKLSVHGMHSAVKELLELAPLNKVMFSTDGYAFPETFYLGTKWAREVITSVLLDACDDGDLSIQEAIEAAQKILRGNAINFYKLDEDTTQILKSKVVNVAADSHTQYLEAKEGKQPKLIRLLWVDNSGQQRCRVVPENRFNQVVRDHGVGLTYASMAMTSFSDSPAEGSHLTGVGEIRLMPDISTLCSMPWSDQEKMVLVDMHSTPGQPWDYCPRTTLRRIATKLEEEFGLVVNAGFESEFYLLRREDNNNWIPIDSTPYCSTAAFDGAASILLEVLKALQSMHISVEQLHAEAGNGQFEVALGYSSCVCSADNLVFLRETISAVANKNCLRATFLPKYFPMDIGSGCHAHISLWKDGKNKFMAEDESVTQYGMSKIGEEFMAGVFHHLPSIMAFTTPLPNSYDRLQPNTWSGAYHCWGMENREAPIRTACPPGISSGVVSNFEIKTFDGCANPYLGLAAIIAAGMDGLQKHLILPEPIASNPADLKEGTVQRLPKSLDEAGNAILFRGHHGRVKIMKLDGQVLKVKGPVTVDDVLTDYPGFVILHSEAVRHMGVRAKPLDGSASLNAKHLYFLVQLPKVENNQREPRRVRSGIPMDAKSRLESMLLARRSISDISRMNFEPSSDTSSSDTSEDNGAMRVKVRMKKAQLIEMMTERQESSETMERILDSCLNHAKSHQMERENVNEDREEKEGNLQWQPSVGGVAESYRKTQVNHARFRQRTIETSSEYVE